MISAKKDPNKNGTQGPEETCLGNEDTIPKIEIKKPASKAAGLAAIIQTMKFMIREPGLLKGIKGLLRMNQKNGFDCSSCAWPDPSGHRSKNEYCENGAKALASESTRKKITSEFFRNHSLKDLSQKTDYWHELQGRLTEPMFKDVGETHYSPISWSESYNLISAELQNLDSPNEASFYTSGRASNEAAFVYQLMVRLFGTNNLPDCSNMCHESSGAALVETIGIGKGTVDLNDFERADVIFVVGQNPGTNHPRMLSALQDAVRRGSTVISVNPIFEAGLKAFAHPQEIRGAMNLAMPIAADHVAIKPGGDLAFFKALGKSLIEKSEHNSDILDHQFISDYTKNFEHYKKSVQSASWEELIENSGVQKNQIDRIANVVSQSRGMITCWAMGITQTENAVATIREIVNLHLCRGQIGKKGAGLCPVRGHSNVQGDRTMGIWEKMPKSFHDSLDTHLNFKSPRNHGYDVVETIRAMETKKVRFFMALGGNFLSASPDTERTSKAIEKCSMTVQISTKLNRSHCIVGEKSLILPCLVRSEEDRQEDEKQIISTENSMGIVQSSLGIFKPISSNLRSEIEILCKIAIKLFPERSDTFEGFFKNHDQIRDMIEKVIPGFESYNLRVRKRGGFSLPNGPKKREFKTKSGKALFTSNEILKNNYADNILILQTLRSHDQFNTTVYGLEDRYRGIYNDRNVIMMNEDDMKSRSIKPLMKVDVVSIFKGKERHLRNLKAVPYKMPRGACAAYFPEANVLVPLDKTAKVSNTPTSKDIPVRISQSG
jgi:molybdopterin-dependent oxidoreductase alpha subunit